MVESYLRFDSDHPAICRTVKHPDAFHTILKEGRGDFRDRGSKFPSYAMHTDSEEALKVALEQVRKDHPTARHICYAAVIGSSDAIERVNDDGEPSGTAGLPILNQIHSHNLMNTTVVVVRYFGGTKLGKSGLINAYKTSAASAIEASRIGERFNMKAIRVQFPYDLTGDVMHRLEQLNHIEIVEHIYEQECSIRFEIPESQATEALHLFNYSDAITIRPVSD